MNEKALKVEHGVLTAKENTQGDDKEVKDTIKNKKTDYLIPMTVRFSKEANDIFQELADKHKVSKAQVVRLAAAGSLERYFGNLEYIDRRQAQVINKNICSLGRLMQEMTKEIRRIGINYNQELKLRNIERKKKQLEEKDKSLGFSVDEVRQGQVYRRKIRELDREALEIKSDPTLLNKQELKNIIERYEEATKKVSEALWFIQE